MNRYVYVNRPSDSDLLISTVNSVVELWPSIRERGQFSTFMNYQLSYDDLNVWPGFVYHYLAEQFLGRASLWHLIADANQLRHPSDWVPGETILIPQGGIDRSVAEFLNAG